MLKALFSTACLLMVFSFCKGQNSFRAIIRDSADGDLVPGASIIIKGTKAGAVSDDQGKVYISSVTNGDVTFVASLIGYKQIELTLHFPLSDTTARNILLPSESIEEEEVTVTSTRTNSRIENVPVRIEVIGQEDLEEETVMQPANISNLLGETSGIQSQTTSATSGNVSIRIQGLDGRYTQILKDGFPLYGGFSGSLSIMSIPPLDLKQAEVIKGSSSTLYGADAIAGIINFVSKAPSFTPERIIVVNQTSRQETDLGAFFSGRTNKIGYTLLVNSVSGQAVDVNGDGFSDAPQLSQLSFAPKLFFYGKDSALFTVGMNVTYEDRIGGDMYAIRYKPDSLHPYLERSQSQRDYSQMRYDCKLSDNAYLTLKNSVGLYDRSLQSGDSYFKGQQLNSFSEASVFFREKAHNLVIGSSFNTEDFKEDKTLSLMDRSYNYSTIGAFIQDDWHPGKHVVVEGGLREDYQNRFGSYTLPRLSMLYHFTSNFSGRLGGGMGYKSPTVFTEIAEEAGYRNVMPIDKTVKPENATGANLDFTYKFYFGNVANLTLNQAFYYTRLQSPLVEDSISYSKGIIRYINASSPVISQGLESNIRFSTHRIDVVVAYTYIDAKQEYDKSDPYLDYVPKHRLVGTFVVNTTNKWRFGLESFYTGIQHLPDHTLSRDYFVGGLMVSKAIGNFTIVVNGENLTDTRQTRFENVVLGPETNPTFRPIYAPLEGRVVNLVVRMNF